MKKLKNNSGATILMALLLILLAMAVGAAILTAAVSAAHHMKSDREAQQNYLTVSSAAELIRDSIAGDKYERTMTETHTANTDEEGHTTYTVSYSTNVNYPTGIMGQWLSACIEDGSENVQYASLKDFKDTIEVDLKIDEDTSLRTVRADFFAQKDGQIQVQLSLKPEEGKTDDCRMTLTMQGTLTQADPEYRSDGDDYSNTYKTTVKWEPQRITKGIEVTGP
ncbi:hypothetical protein GPK87_02855 [Oscillibacter sp. MCC667]|uniref:hypothetical protein n=1 Tax=Dysosmobacter sp. TaxID=2591382 RepID=UPI001C01FDAC|nr:hypothetical protein [Oscillibacter sp. MCC667]